MSQPARTNKFKIFVINLDRAKDRMAHMDAMLKRLGLEYERIPAVDGSKLTPEDIKKNYSPFWFGFFHGRQISPGELGCAMSHRIAYRKILDEGLDWALVLEDDVEIDPVLVSELKALALQTTGFDVVQLYYSENRPHPIQFLKLMGGRQHIAFTGAHASAVAYLVKTDAARKFLRWKKVFLTADKFSWFAALHGIRFSAVKPFLVWPKQELNAMSTIDQTDTIADHRGRIDRKYRAWKIFQRPALLGFRKSLISVRALARLV